MSMFLSIVGAIVIGSAIWAMIWIAITVAMFKSKKIQKWILTHYMNMTKECVQALEEMEEDLF